MPGRVVTQPDRPAPAPTDSGVCAISPSDLVGYVGNLINLVKDLEQRVIELESGNIEANQLSDISQQVGWVSGVTYMGVPGWTQTSYGTLIPPTGAGVYYAVTPELTGWFDNEGNLLMGGPSFHGSSSGTVSGSLVDTWNAAAAGSSQDYARATYSAGIGWDTEERGANVTTNTQGTGSVDNEIEISIATAGLYIVQGWFSYKLVGTLGFDLNQNLQMVIQNLNDSNQYLFVDDGMQTPEANADGRISVAAGGAFLMDAGDTISSLVTLFPSLGASSKTVRGYSLSVARISS